jgi:hypothetical protein
MLTICLPGKLQVSWCYNLFGDFNQTLFRFWCDLGEIRADTTPLTSTTTSIAICPMWLLLGLPCCVLIYNCFFWNIYFSCLWRISISLPHQGSTSPFSFWQFASLYNLVYVQVQYCTASSACSSFLSLVGVSISDIKKVFVQLPASVCTIACNSSQDRSVPENKDFQPIVTIKLLLLGIALTHVRKHMCMCRVVQV